LKKVFSVPFRALSTSYSQKYYNYHSSVGHLEVSQ